MRVLNLILIISGSLFSQISHFENSDSLEKSAANIIYADSLYNFAVSKLTFLDYEDCNNCTLRAHVMCFVFPKLVPEIKISKVWLFADSKVSSKRDFYRTHNKEYLSGISRCVHWGFHVAPLLLIGNDTIVIDPSTQNSPVKLDKWVNDISKETPAIIVIKKPMYYSFPDDENDLFDDRLEEWQLKYDVNSLESEISFIAQKLTTSNNSMFDPIRFYNYRIKISRLISYDPN